MPVTIDLFTSKKIKSWFFISMIMMLFVHSYNLNERYLRPFSIVHERMTFNSFAQYFLSNGLFRFFVPMLFSISGYLYASHDERPYIKNIRKRIQTILLPYLLWSAIGIIFTYLIELSSYGRGIVEVTDLMNLSNNRILLHDYKWYELLWRWLFLPIPYQLWFLRVLFIYNLVYPALRWCVLKYANIFFIIVIIFWMSDISFILFEGEGLFFFSLGIWLQKKNYNIREPGKWIKPLPWTIVFVFLNLIKTILAFEGFYFIGTAVFPILLVSYKVVVISGFISAWFGSDKLIRWCAEKRWFVWLSAFSFIIYTLHAPLVAYAINAIFPLVQNIDEYSLLTYLFLPAGLIIFCVGTGAIVRSLLPKLYALMTGGRG